MCYAEMVVLDIYLNRRIRLLRDAPNWVCNLSYIRCSQVICPKPSPQISSVSGFLNRLGGGGGCLESQSRDGPEPLWPSVGRDAPEDIWPPVGIGAATRSFGLKFNEGGGPLL